MYETFKDGQLVVYRNGDRYEIGKIKHAGRLSSYVWYHEGDTVALTDNDLLWPIVNAHCIKQESLGKGGYVGAP